MRFSQEQSDAIQARGESLLVSAAAGSGKTAVLIERILTLLTEGHSLEGMLIVTFSRAAAAEMRSRLQSALTERANTPHLRAQRSAVQRAHIRTLHSFCEWLLRQCFLQASVPPTFRVDGGALLLPMRLRAMEEALDAALLEDGDELARLCGVDDLPDLVARLHTFLRNQPDPQGFAKRMLDEYRSLESFSTSPYAAQLERKRQSLLRQGIGWLEEAIRLCGRAQGLEKYLPVLADDLQALTAMQRSGAEPSFATLPRATGADEDAKRAVQSLRKQVKDKSVKPAAELHRLCSEEGARLALDMLPALDALCRLALEYDRLYTQYKLDAGVLDFNDLEHRAILALKDDEVRRDMRERFSHVFVDEYQDINAVQEAILRSLCRQDNRFVVGDVKQSIYRFRLADPGIFLDTAARYAHGDGGRRIDLNRNYRSAPHILEAVNHIFSRAMRGGAAEIEYDARAALYPGREEQAENPAVDVILVCPPDAEALAEDDPAAEMRLAELEAHVVAERIAQLAGEPIPDGQGGTRPIRFGDIAILLRSPGSIQHAYLTALEALDIPVSADTGGALFSAPEVQAFLEVLRAIDNRQRDVPLLGAMRSIGGFSSADLAAIRAEHREGAFFEAMEAMAAGQGELAERCSAFLQRLLTWRSFSRRMPLGDFLAMVLQESGLENRHAVLPRETPLQNLRAFCHRAAAMGGATLGDFLFAADQGLFAEDGGGDGAQQPPKEHNAVRILSVHKSKGLEFPVVIGAGLGTRFNLRDLNEAVLMSRTLGFAPRYVDRDIRVRMDTPATLAIVEEKRAQSLAEELRILYVLMTRAREKLLLTAAVPSPEKAAEGWAMGGEDFLTARCPLDWIGPALLRHPDGGPLRELYGGTPPVEAHAARYRVEIAAGFARQLTPVRIGIERLRHRPADIPDALPPDVEQAIAYEYPLPSPDPLKTSVTAKLYAHQHTALPPERPAFLREERDLTPSQRGSAVHAALRALDLSPLNGLGLTDTLTEVQRQIEGMAQRRLLSDEQAAAVDAGAIAAFLSSPLGREALGAQTLLREQPFNLRVDSGDAIRLMQGIIDLAYLRPDGQWVVVDYKTDRGRLSPAEVTERHGGQLRQYGHALASLTDRPVGRLTVYLFANGRTVDIEEE